MEFLCDLKEQGNHVPALLEENVPDLRSDQEYILSIFFHLARSRSPSMSGWLAPVVLSEIAVAYKYFDLAGFMTHREFCSWMQMLDSAVIEHFAPKKTKDKDDKKPTL